MYTLTFFQRSKAARSWVERLLLLVLLVATSFSSFAQSITGPDYIYIDVSRNPTNGANTTYAAKNAGGATAFTGSLGTYLIGKGNNAPDDMLLFQGGQITTSEPKVGTGNPNNPKFQTAQLYYRVFPQNQAGNTAFNFIPLDELSAQDNGTTITRVFRNTAAGIDLVGSVSAQGIYTIEVYLQVNYVTVNSSGITTNTVTYQDNNPTTSGTAQNYQANFEVTGVRQNTTIWRGGVSDNWFDPNNWSNNLPNSLVDAYIPYPGAGSTVQYPKIYANGGYQTSTTSTIGMGYGGESYPAATVRSLKFGGGSATAKATAELVTGNLLIYNDFTGDYNNFIQDASTVVTFAGSAPQSLSMISNGEFKTVNIAGVGTKTLIGTMNIANSLNFGGGTFGGVAVTGTSQLIASNAGNLVSLQTAQLADGTAVAARINNETSSGYVLGNTIVKVLAMRGVSQDFGNIGITLNFDAAYGAPGNVSITRITGQPFNGVNPSSGAYSIKRSFTVTPDNPNTAGNGLRASLAFKYLSVDYTGVGPNNITLDDSHFYLAFSTNSTSFTSLGYTTRDDNTTVNNDLLTKDGVTSFALFTLADDRNPLPVSLVAFNAKRSGDVALITWETAMERNNKGFDVEVSTDGTTFRTLGFVGSNSPDSNVRLAYSYTDAEANKSGIRYYRLHQLDYNGKDDYSPVRAVSFAAAGEGVAALSAYPNPFNNDEIKLALQSNDAGQATLRLTDLTGRQVSAQTFTAVKGVTEVSIDQAAQLAAGSYMAQITAPSGEIKTVRIQKR